MSNNKCFFNTAVQVPVQAGQPTTYGNIFMSCYCCRKKAVSA